MGKRKNNLHGVELFFEEETHRELRLKAAGDGRPLSVFLQGVIRDWLRDQSKPTAITVASLVAPVIVQPKPPVVVAPTPSAPKVVPANQPRTPGSQEEQDEIAALGPRPSDLLSPEYLLWKQKVLAIQKKNKF